MRRHLYPPTASTPEQELLHRDETLSFSEAATVKIEMIRSPSEKDRSYQTLLENIKGDQFVERQPVNNITRRLSDGFSGSLSLSHHNLRINPLTFG